MHFNIACADVLDWAAEYDGPKFHAVLTDPPYSWGFMSKKWDNGIALRPDTWAALAQHLHPGAFIMAFGGPRTYHRLACAMEDAGLRLHSPIGWINGQGFPKATKIKINEWARTGEPRMMHTDSGGNYDDDNYDWGEKYQNSLEPATDLARAWQGHRYGLQSLKPSIEFIAVAQKPYEGRPVDCIVETGAGALNIDGGRIGTEQTTTHNTSFLQFGGQNTRPWQNGHETFDTVNQGRWPANFCLAHSPGCRRAGVKRVDSKSKATAGGRRKGGGTYGDYKGYENPPEIGYADPDGLETVDDWICTEDCPVRLLGEQSGNQNSGRHGKAPGGFNPTGKTLYGKGDPQHDVSGGYADKGTAARFFFQADWSYEIAERLAGLEMPVMYCPKAAKKERDAGLESLPLSFRTKGHMTSRAEREGRGERQNTTMRNPHPTVKPITLCKWLATLLLPPLEYAPRRILVPFSGSGSEMIAAGLAGWEEIVGVEISQEYCDIAEARLEHWLNGRQLELAL